MTSRARRMYKLRQPLLLHKSVYPEARIMQNSRAARNPMVSARSFFFSFSRARYSFVSDFRAARVPVSGAAARAAAGVLTLFVAISCRSRLFLEEWKDFLGESGYCFVMDGIWDIEKNLVYSWRKICSHFFYIYGNFHENVNLFFIESNTVLFNTKFSLCISVFKITIQARFFISLSYADRTWQ